MLLVPAALLVFTLGVSGGLPAGARSGSAPSRGTSPLDEVHVEVADFSFAPTTVALGRGQTVVFDFVGPSHHTATDSSGMGLYDSGSVGAGGPSTSYTFPAAGVYRFTCTPHPGMGGRVAIPMRVSPASGGLHRTFHVTWAATVAPEGFVYDVQIQKPGRDWADWRNGVVGRKTSFTPNAGKGKYRFRARMRSLDGGEAFWSAEAVMKVT
ncbi:MAG: plastocyanin/azurin family copper-binding protein [Myxococcota bacterium]